MVESINAKVEYVTDGTSFMGPVSYGKIMIGDRGFEFYDDRDVRNFIQIPWDEIDLVIASLVFGGHWIPRFKIRTRHNGEFIFTAKNTKATLRAVRKHVDPQHMVRALTFTQKLKRGWQGMQNSRKHSTK